MFARWRLPPDDFPDDTETAAFQNYREGARPRWGWLPHQWQRWLAYGGAGLVVLVLGLSSWVAYQGLTREAEPTSPPSTPTATPRPLVMTGEFPAEVNQIYINVPARIDDSLPAGTARGYTFYPPPGVTWEFQVIATETDGFVPRISLYGPEGQLIASADGGADGTPTELNHFIQSEALYALLLEGVGGSGGAYTLRVLPQNLP